MLSTNRAVVSIYFLLPPATDEISSAGEPGYTTVPSCAPDYAKLALEVLCDQKRITPLTRKCFQRHNSLRRRMSAGVFKVQQATLPAAKNPIPDLVAASIPLSRH